MPSPPAPLPGLGEGQGVRASSPSSPSSPSPIVPGSLVPVPCTTTDPQHELFDTLTPDGQPTGVSKPRGLVHRDGDWHAALHIWLGGVGADGPFVLFQRRALGKDTWPGALDISIGGHLRAGETLVEATREAEEELGLALALDALTYIGRRWVSWEQAGVRDNELQHVYALRNDAQLTAYRLHPVEVDALIAVPIDAALRLFAGELTSVPARVMSRAGALSSAPVSMAEFVPERGNYLSLALTALGALLRGEPVTPFELRVGGRAAAQPALKRDPTGAVRGGGVP